jgi:hypothetical protein
VAVTVEIQKRAIEIIDKLKNRYIRSDILDIVGYFKGQFLYIDALREKYVRSKGIRTLKPKRNPLCRLKYHGNFDEWELQMYKYSDNWYDTCNDFMFPGGSIETCFRLAVKQYLY